MKDKRVSKINKMQIGSMSAMIIIVIFLLAIMGFSSSSVSSADEATLLEQELIDAGYGWLVNYNLSYPSVDVYEKDGNELIASFEPIKEDGKYRILLTNLTGGECYDNMTEILTRREVSCDSNNYVIIGGSNKNKNRSQDVTRMVSNFSQDYDNYYYTRYLNVSADANLDDDFRLEEGLLDEKCYIEEWKLFSELNGSEDVMTLNASSGEEEWQKPTAYQEFDNSKLDGEMYKIVLEDGSDLLVSSKHKVYVSVDEKFDSISVKGVYDVIKEGRQVWFIDKDKKEVIVDGIEKVDYNDKIFDVDVQNDIVLVRRWNNLETREKYYNHLKELNKEKENKEVFDLTSEA